MHPDAPSLPGPRPDPAAAPADAAVLGPPGSVLVVDDDPMILALVGQALRSAGYAVTVAGDGRQALARLHEALPDVIVSDVNMPGVDGFDLVRQLRQSPALGHLPLIFLTSRTSGDDVIAGLGLGADDYLTKPFDVSELLARVAAKISRPTVPADRLSTDRRSGLVGVSAFLAAATRERERSLRSGRTGWLAVVGVAEAPTVRDRFGTRAVDELVRQLARELQKVVGPLEVAGRTDDGRFALLLPEAGQQGVVRRLQSLAEHLARAPLVVAGERLHVTLLTGFVDLAAGSGPDQALDWADRAFEHAAANMDLQPVLFTPAMLPAEPTRGRRGAHGSPPGTWWRQRARTPLQFLITLVVGVVLPFLLYYLADRAGFSIAPAAYLVVVLALLVTAGAIWVEGLLALDPVQPPPARQEQPATDGPPLPYPAASAVIAAFLPNEAATILETVEAFQRLDYPGELQVILAYNTPVDLPVESVLAAMAARDPRLIVLRVEGSTSKAQNVNAALAEVRGEFVGVFDADHHPEPNSFRRAWRWLDAGYDVVQGHAVVRNGDASWVARMVAVEFEMIYAVSHPGRARLHGFGIFGGSNGYWRSELLRMTRMRGSMLTEDIDSSMRVVEAGYRIASDPYLVSRELAPTTLRALWNQRMRWAQGWFQVSQGHLFPALASRSLTLRQKGGFGFLLGWREVYPWLSLQMYPIVAFLAVKAGGPNHLNYLVPIFVLTTLFTLSVGPWQTLFAYRQADPEIRRRKGWFLGYLLLASVFYSEFKNVIGRVAQVKQTMGEKAWKVTPRAVGTAGATATGVRTVPTDTLGANDPLHPAAGTARPEPVLAAPERRPPRLMSWRERHRQGPNR